MWTKKGLKSLYENKIWNTNTFLIINVNSVIKYSSIIGYNIYWLPVNINYDYARHMFIKTS